jgi:hypothetical protein
MVDKTTLGFFGFFLAGVTVAVTIVAYIVVRDTIDGRLPLDGNPASASVAAAG